MAFFTTLGIGSLLALAAGKALASSLGKLGTDASSTAYKHKNDLELQEKGHEFDMLKQHDQQAFDLSMKSTENQRKVTDLQKAGLNPALMSGATHSVSGGTQSTARNTAQSTDVNSLLTTALLVKLLTKK